MDARVNLFTRVSSALKFINTNSFPNNMKPALKKLHDLYKSLYLLKDQIKDQEQENSVLEEITIQESGLPAEEVIEFHCFMTGEFPDNPDRAKEHYNKADFIYRTQSKKTKKHKKMLDKAKERLKSY